MRFSEIPIGTPALTDYVVGVTVNNVDSRFPVKDIGGGRTLLTANITRYVRVTGSDSNDGLTPATAWATLQHAGNVIAANLDIAGFTVFVNVGVGSFPGVTMPSVAGGGQVRFIGAGSGSTTITDSSDALGCISINISTTTVVSANKANISPSVSCAAAFNNTAAGAEMVVGDADGVTTDLILTGVLTGSVCIFVGAPALVSVASAGGTIQVQGAWIAGFECGDGGVIVDFGNWTMVSTPSFAAFAIAFAGAEIDGGSASYSGAATGPQQILGSGASATGAFPGNSFGLVDSSASISGRNGPLPGINTQTTDYTLALTDYLKIVEMNVGIANTFTIPLNATVPCPVGMRTWVTQIGVGATTVAGAVGVTVHNAGAVGGQWKSVKLYQRATDEWVQTNA